MEPGLFSYLFAGTVINMMILPNSSNWYALCYSRILSAAGRDSPHGLPILEIVTRKRTSTMEIQLKNKALAGLLCLMVILGTSVEVMALNVGENTEGYRINEPISHSSSDTVTQFLGEEIRLDLVSSKFGTKLLLQARDSERASRFGIHLPLETDLLPQSYFLSEDLNKVETTSNLSTYIAARKSVDLASTVNTPDRESTLLILIAAGSITLFGKRIISNKWLHNIRVPRSFNPAAPVVNRLKA